MSPIYFEFLPYIEAENREAALAYIISKLNSKELDIITLYDEILAPSLNNMPAAEDDIAFIWKEHVRSSIIRTIIENCYPYVIRERNEKYKLKNNKNVAVVCPIEEYHEIGARMITDFFTLLGYNSIFVGSNTPKEEFISALNIINLDYIAISVSNHYNLVAARKTIEKIRESQSKVKIIVGGNAFNSKPGYYKDLGADMHIQTFEDLKKLAEVDGI